jgi:hypothetical protein
MTLRDRMTPVKFLILSVALLSLAAADAPTEISLFDGQTLTNWEGNQSFWQVKDGVITAGSLDRKFPHNDFLVSTRSFQNFDLRLKIRLLGFEGFVNSGVQFRSVRVPNNFEMSGYQADAGEGYWGSLYDETRRDRTLVKPTDPEAMNKAFHKDDWNDYRIRADGPHIELWLNGVKTVDYTEPDPSIPQDGFIGLQIHGNGKTVVEFKDIFITELSTTPDAPTWAKLGGYKPWKKK